MMTTEEMVIELIEEIKRKMKEMRLDAEKVFLNGNCGNMYTILANYFSNKAVVPYIISCDGYPYHIVTQIDEEFYDITGKTSLDKYVDYIKSHNKGFEKSEFTINKIDIAERKEKVNKMSNMYAYDEAFNQSSIEREMYMLQNHINGFKSSRQIR